MSIPQSQEDFDSAKEDLEAHGKKIKELGEELEGMKDEITTEEKKELMEK